MMKPMHVSLLLAILGCLLSSSVADIPAIDEREGFEVDIEPMWVDFELVGDDPTPLDVSGYFSTEMKTMLPNIIGVILKKFENTEGNDSTQVFYTGSAVFQGPPFRTNHDVFEAQTAAMISLRAAASYLHVYNASMGIPPWFDASVLGDKNVKLDEETDGSSILNPFDGTNDSAFSLGSMLLGMAVGFIIGALLATVVMWSRCATQRKQDKKGAPHSPAHKRKVSNISLENIDIDDDDDDDESVSLKSSNSFREEFHDEENPMDAQVPPSPDRMHVLNKSSTPQRSRPSHHRRWKSSAFHDMQSPNSVMDGINDASSNHRRSNSVAGTTGRRPSMVDLLAVDIAELTNDTEEFNDD